MACCRARRGVFTNNDRAYQAAIDLADCGARVVVVDARAPVDGILPDAARRLGVTVMAGAVVMAAHGKRRVASVDVHAYARASPAARRDLPCDLLAMSGGLSPVLHLHAQSGGKPQWLERKACFVPGKSVQAEASVGRRPASSTCVSRWRRQPRWRRSRQRRRLLRLDGAAVPGRRPPPRTR